MSEENTFDVIIVGSGPAGYVAAIRSAQLGFKTALIEKNKHLGGTCLNVGCIPSKALLHSTEMYHFASHGAEAHGISHKDLKIDIKQLMSKKSATVDQLRAGIVHLMKTNKIQVFEGLGSLIGGNQVSVTGAAEETLSANHIIIATGSRSIELPFLPFDGETVVSSDQAIAFEEIPEKIPSSKRGR